MDQNTEPSVIVRSQRPAPSRGRLWLRLAIMAAILIAVFAGLYGFEKFKQGMIAQFMSVKPPPSPVAVVKAEMAAVPRNFESIGTSSAVNQVTVSPQVAGRVITILFESGAVVKAGEPLVQLDDGAERADLATYQAQAKLAQVNLSRASALAKEKVGPQANVDTQQSNLDVARAGIQRSQVLIDQKLIRAPFSGTLGIRQVDLGRYVGAGTALVTLTNLDKLLIDFTLPEHRSSSLEVGLPVEIRADAYPDRVFKAELTSIEPQIDPLTRAIKLQATMANPEHLLQPGMFVRARTILPPEGEAVILPETVVDYTTYGESVFLVQEDGKDESGATRYKAVQTFVDTGLRYEGKVAVTKGVKAGDLVINGGQLRVHNGAAVVPTENDALEKPAVTPLE